MQICQYAGYIVTYGVIKFMWDKFMQPGLDSHNLHKKISHRNLSLYRVLGLPEQTNRMVIPLGSELVVEEKTY